MLTMKTSENNNNCKTTTAVSTATTMTMTMTTCTPSSILIGKLRNAVDALVDPSSERHQYQQKEHQQLQYQKKQQQQQKKLQQQHQQKEQQQTNSQQQQHPKHNHFHLRQPQLLPQYQAQSQEGQRQDSSHQHHYYQQQQQQQSRMQLRSQQYRSKYRLSGYQNRNNNYFHHKTTTMVKTQSIIDILYDLSFYIPTSRKKLPLSNNNIPPLNITIHEINKCYTIIIDALLYYLTPVIHPYSKTSCGEVTVNNEESHKGGEDLISALLARDRVRSYHHTYSSNIIGGVGTSQQQPTHYNQKQHHHHHYQEQQHRKNINTQKTTTTTTTKKRNLNNILERIQALHSRHFVGTPSLVTTATDIVNGIDGNYHNIYNDDEFDENNDYYYENNDYSDEDYNNENAFDKTDLNTNYEESKNNYHDHFANTTETAAVATTTTSHNNTTALYYFLKYGLKLFLTTIGNPLPDKDNNINNNMNISDDSMTEGVSSSSESIIEFIKLIAAIIAPTDSCLKLYYKNNDKKKNINNSNDKDENNKTKKGNDGRPTLTVCHNDDDNNQSNNNNDNNDEIDDDICFGGYLNYEANLHNNDDDDKKDTWLLHCSMRRLPVPPSVRAAIVRIISSSLVLPSPPSTASTRRHYDRCDNNDDNNNSSDNDSDDNNYDNFSSVWDEAIPLLRSALRSYGKSLPLSSLSSSLQASAYSRTINMIDVTDKSLVSIAVYEAGRVITPTTTTIDPRRKRRSNCNCYAMEEAEVLLNRLKRREEIEERNNGNGNIIVNNNIDANDIRNNNDNGGRNSDKKKDINNCRSDSETNKKRDFDNNTATEETHTKKRKITDGKHNINDNDEINVKSINEGVADIDSATGDERVKSLSSPLPSLSPPPSLLPTDPCPWRTSEPNSNNRINRNNLNFNNNNKYYHHHHIRCRHCATSDTLVNLIRRRHNVVTQKTRQYQTHTANDNRMFMLSLLRKVRNVFVDMNNMGINSSSCSDSTTNNKGNPTVKVAATVSSCHIASLLDVAKVLIRFLPPTDNSDDSSGSGIINNNTSININNNNDNDRGNHTITNTNTDAIESKVRSNDNYNVNDNDDDDSERGIRMYFMIRAIKLLSHPCRCVRIAASNMLVPVLTCYCHSNDVDDKDHKDDNNLGLDLDHSGRGMDILNAIRFTVFKCRDDSIDWIIENNSRSTTDPTGLREVIIATSRRSASFAKGAVRMLVEIALSLNNDDDSDNDFGDSGMGEVNKNLVALHRYIITTILGLIQCVASTRPSAIVSQLALLERLGNIVEDNKDGKLSLLSLYLSCRLAFHDASPPMAVRCRDNANRLLGRSTSISILTSNSKLFPLRLDPWTLYRVARHAMCTANFGIAAYLYSHGRIGVGRYCSSPESALWMDCLADVAKSEDILSWKGAKGLPCAIPTLGRSIGNLSSLSSLYVGRENGSNGSGRGGKFKFQLRLLTLRRHFLQICVTISSLCAEMRLTEDDGAPLQYRKSGGGNKKGIRSRTDLHQRNLPRCLRKLASRYRDLCRSRRRMCQQTLTSIRNASSLCHFLEKAVSVTFLVPLQPLVSTLVEPVSLHPSVQLATVLWERIMGKLNERVKPQVRAAALSVMVEAMLRAPFPFSRGFLKIE